MELILKKRAQKYLDSVDANTKKKLYKALNKLAELDGDIKRLEGYPDRYRFKIDHYRIIFERVKGELIIVVIEITTRSDAYKRR